VQWDADRVGVMEGEQHNTTDIEFYGPNTMMGTLYLGAPAASRNAAAVRVRREAAEIFVFDPPITLWAGNRLEIAVRA
jgi:hypothetical protein